MIIYYTLIFQLHHSIIRSNAYFFLSCEPKQWRTIHLLAFVSVYGLFDNGYEFGAEWNWKIFWEKSQDFLCIFLLKKNMILWMKSVKYTKFIDFNWTIMWFNPLIEIMRSCHLKVKSRTVVTLFQRLFAIL